ncbi:MAG: molecular chaperone DnaK [Methanomicrobiales archaeon]|nr:molecular chaperone DnaK [Methanomicrobiales archaeon]MDI6876362.1 molecular chaperone DnaK [Methanomicrobiales archaeon]
MSKEKIIGIDLGTSNSQAAVMLGGKPTIIPSAEGATVAGKMFPSVVAIAKDGQLLVGEPARRQAVSNPEGTVLAAKRKIGTNHTYTIHGKQYTPQQISAFILQKIKRDAEAFLGEEIKKAVITVPAYFNDNQRTATKDAGRIAGLDVVRLVNEPTAASMAYGLDKAGEHKILVFDLGGGTLDVTIMEFGGGTFTVLSTSGDTQLGGTDMDNAVVDWIVEEFKKQEGVDLRKDKMAIQRVREAAEKAKIELSSVLETEINLPYITVDKEGPKHLALKLSRSRLEQLVDPIISRCIHPIEQALADAKLTKRDLNKVILVGGPTRMPAVVKFIEEQTGLKPERGVDPMECVAMGAAIQGAILAGEITDLLLLDVTPLTLGIETLGGVMTPLIERNTTIPTRKSQIFSTASDFQTAVTIHVLQGERPMAADNISLGQFNLVGIPPAPRGVPQIEVEFDIDASGILNVSAKDRGTGKEQKMTISASTKLSDKEVEKMIQQAKEFEEEDRKRREEVETRNNADSMIYTAEKTLSELGDKIGAEQKDRLESAIKTAKSALEGKDMDRIRQETENLQKVLQDVGTVIYQEAARKYAEEAAEKKAAGESSGNAEGPSGSKDKEKVVDAEFKVEEE